MVGPFMVSNIIPTICHIYDSLHNNFICLICYDVDTLQNLSRKLVSPAAATGMAAGCAVEQLGVAAAELTHAGLALLHKFKSNASVRVREHCAIFY